MGGTRWKLPVVLGLVLAALCTSGFRAHGQGKLQADPGVREEWQKELSRAELFRVVKPQTLAYCWGLRVAPTRQAAEEQEELGLPKLLTAGDVDGDGKREVICATDAGWLLMFAHDGRFMGKLSVGAGIRCLCSRDLYGDRDAEIIVGGRGLTVLNGHGDVLWEHAGPVSALFAADIDRDGVVEIAVVGQGLQVLNGRTGDVEWDADVAGAGLAGCDLDGDGRCELIVSSSAKLSVVSSTGELIWAKDKPEGQHGSWSDKVVAADLLGDRHPEIVAGSYMHACAFDWKGKELWSRSDPAGIKCIVVGDTDKDGKAEVAFGSTSWDVHVYNGDGSPIAALPAQSWVEAVTFADLTGDGRDEIICGSTGKPCFVYASEPEGKLLWRHFTGYDVSAILAQDLDRDGETEVVVASDDVCFLDHKGVLKRRFALGGRAHTLAEDLDGDGQVETVRGSNLLAVYDEDGNLTWARDVAHVWSLKAADVDRDGTKELIVGCLHNTVYLISAEGKLKWQRRLDWIRGKVSVEERADGERLDIVVEDDTYSYRFSATGKLLNKERRPR